MQGGGSKTGAGDKEKPCCFFTFPLEMEGENSAEDIFLAFVGPELLKNTQAYLSFSNQRVQRKHCMGGGGAQGP